MLVTMMTDELDLSSAQSLQLKPNCLLTRREIVFLTPPRSLFFYKNPWGQIRSVLTAHGYKTDLLQLPFQSVDLQKKVLTQNSENLNHKHLIIDSVTYTNVFAELESIKKTTITVVTVNTKAMNQDHYLFTPTEIHFSLSYWLHQKWCALQKVKTPKLAETMTFCSQATWHSFLDHCVSLAELDFEQD